ncbi:GATOR complex protein DEPDC5 isoform X2 [Cimex lectularius]|uniref:DEP domain-containing protein n=1 Tax=Cimex lectularius TaxID=79782 RepID=A0A8I6TK35_CIMLE|nr:GATOR complex protein DEPDC5 isoform X2 [Cimex lectularius]
MKLYKLIVHTKGFSGENLIINPKDFPNLNKGDIVEIYHPEDEFSRLLLQITLFKEDLQGRDVVSVEQSIATTFQLRTYADVHVNVVDPDSVSLDSVEIIFKDQYLGRSEMWRLKNSLVNTCVYLTKKIEFCGGSIRCQVHEMWSLGDRVACGVITESTKVVFRSSTSMVYLFLQMSSEMWDFDIHGDLYFEKAVNGFLADLFQKWKKHGSNHEVTIVLFSRTFYKAQSLDEFPHFMRECLQQDYKGRFYEDFYRVAIQNEKYDDWSHALVELRKLFSNYRKSVLEYNNRPNTIIPKAVNSTAAQGNFLEVLNMSLNVFEKHYLDRSFDRTGQLSVVITPGVGVFEVDRELTNVTKQRVIDNGVGSDLVCLGEQPLHAVPLLKFHNKDSPIATNNYSMPHWINLSFYSSNKRVAYSNFIPRIKLPPKKSKHSIATSTNLRTKALYEEEEPFNSVVNYDAYDAQVFTVPLVQTKNVKAVKKTSVSGLEGSNKLMVKRKMSDPDIHYVIEPPAPSGPPLSKSPAISIPYKLDDDCPRHSSSSLLQSESLLRGDNTSVSEADSSPSRLLIGSTGSPASGYQPQLHPSSLPRPGRALINPFDPSHITIKLTSNRRRWTHIFPKGPTGQLIQQHHYQAKAPKMHKVEKSSDENSPTKIVSKSKPRHSIMTSSYLHGSHAVNRKCLTLLWGATGEQEWTPALTTASKVLIGVDWKSLTIPACLPITTDYFPDEVCIQTDYLFSDYSLLPDDVNADYAQQRVIYRKPLHTQEVFKELVSQRLAQGFQIIVEDSGGHTPVIVGSSVVGCRPFDSKPTQEYKLSIGRIFHRIVLNGSEISVTRYRPRHPYPPFNFHYWYRFQAPDHPNYGVSWISFTTEKLENFNWNFLDHYICTRGDTDFALIESLKYWRFRMYLLPMCPSVTKRILDGSEHCDLYNPLSPEEQQNLMDNFLKFIELWVNKIRRPQNHKKQRLDLSCLNMPSHLSRRRYSTGILFLKSSVASNSPFRERLGSNRLPEKPRPRSGSKVLERGKVSPSIDSSIPSSPDYDLENDPDSPQVVLLKEGASHNEILEQMKNPAVGVGFLSLFPSLPRYTFVSADAVNWLIHHMEGVNTTEKAQSVMEEILKEKLICHASGDFSQQFIIGFYLYHIVRSKEEAKGEDTDPLGDLQGFSNEWVEVEARQTPELSSIPTFLSKTLPPTCSQVNQKGPMYKESHLEIDVQNKSDRVEWGHLKYQAAYRPDMAYEMVVQWAAASGPIVADLVFGWARKAQSCGLQMVPIPADPFALPYSKKSDPLRGPIFIALDTESLMGTKSYLFEEFEEETWTQRLVLFQETIALSFGFVACTVESSQHQHNQYIHLSGNVFLLIPSMHCEHSTQTVSRSRPVRRYNVSSEINASPHHEYITRHVGNQTCNQDTRVGFLWSWNHMVSRKWKLGTTNATCDESFQNKLLSDFTKFCSNRDNRLRNLWNLCWEQAKEKNFKI